MISDTTHTRHIHLDGDKNNNRMDERLGEIIRGIKKNGFFNIQEVTDLPQLL